jgi:uncharacterized protein YqjF (DUF2071 family)
MLQIQNTTSSKGGGGGKKTAVPQTNVGDLCFDKGFCYLGLFHESVHQQVKGELTSTPLLRPLVSILENAPRASFWHHAVRNGGMIHIDHYRSRPNVNGGLVFQSRDAIAALTSSSVLGSGPFNNTRVGQNETGFVCRGNGVAEAPLPSWSQKVSKPSGFVQPNTFNVVTAPVPSVRVVTGFEQALPTFDLVSAPSPKKSLVLAFKVSKVHQSREVEVPHDDVKTRRVGPVTRQGRNRVCNRCERTPADRIKTWFVLNCESAGLENSVHCPACTSFAVDSYGSSTYTVSESVCVETASVRRVENSSSSALVPRLRNEVVVLPTLSPGVGRTMVRTFPDGDVKVQRAIASSGPFSGLLHRLRAEGRARKDYFSGRFHPAKKAEPPFCLSDDGRFAGLHDESCENLPFFGPRYQAPKGDVVRHHSFNQRAKKIAYQHWVDVCLTRKMVLYRLEKVRQRQIGRLVPRNKKVLGNNLSHVNQRLSALVVPGKPVWYGFQYDDVSRLQFRKLYSYCLSVFSCPDFPCTLSHEGTQMSLVYGGKHLGLSFLSRGKLMGHMGRSDVIFGPITHANGFSLDGRYCKQCRRSGTSLELQQMLMPQAGWYRDWICDKCLVQRLPVLFPSGISTDLNKSDVNMHRDRPSASVVGFDVVRLRSQQVLLDALRPDQECELFSCREDVIHRLGLKDDHFDEVLDCNALFDSVFRFHREFKCPTLQSLFVNVSTSTRYIDVNILDRNLEPGLFISVDGVRLFHAATEPPVESLCIQVEKRAFATGRGANGRHCKLCDNDDQQTELVRVTHRPRQSFHSFICISCYNRILVNSEETVTSEHIDLSSMSLTGRPLVLDTVEASSISIPAHQAILDEVRSDLPAPFFRSETDVMTVLGISLFSFRQTLSLAHLFGIVYAYKMKHRCPVGQEIRISVSSVTRDISIMILNGPTVQGLFIMIDEIHGFHAADVGSSLILSSVEEKHPDTLADVENALLRLEVDAYQRAQDYIDATTILPDRTEWPNSQYVVNEVQSYLHALHGSALDLFRFAVTMRRQFAPLVGCVILVDMSTTGSTDVRIDASAPRDESGFLFAHQGRLLWTSRKVDVSKVACEGEVVNRDINRIDQVEIDAINKQNVDETTIRTEEIQARLMLVTTRVGLEPIDVVRAYKSQYGCPTNHRILLQTDGDVTLYVTKTMFGLPGLFVRKGSVTYLHGAVDAEDKSICTHTKVMVCKHLCAQLSINESTPCDAPAHARSHIVVRKPSLRYWITGNVIAFNINNVLLVSRRKNIFRYEGDNKIMTIQKERFWSTDKPLYITPAGLKRFIFEKLHKNEHGLLHHLAIGLNTTKDKMIKDYRDVNSDADKADVTTEKVDLTNDIEKLSMTVSQTQEKLRSLSEQIMSLVQVPELIDGGSRHLAKQFGRVKTAVSVLERKISTSHPLNEKKVVEVIQPGETSTVKHRRKPSTPGQITLRPLSFENRKSSDLKEKGRIGAPDHSREFDLDYDNTGADYNYAERAMEDYELYGYPSSGDEKSPPRVNIPRARDSTVADVETNPGPKSVVTKMAISDAPHLSVWSATPLDKTDKEFRRTGFLPRDIATESNMFRGVASDLPQQDAVCKHLRQRIRDCKSNVVSHCLWRDRVLCEKPVVQKDVSVATIRRNDTNIHSFVSKAFLHTDPDAQWVVNQVGILTHNLKDKREIEHLVVDIQLLLSETTVALDYDSIVFCAMTWKAVFGCPVKGMVSVVLHPDYDRYDILWSDESPGDFGQINWMIGDRLIAHCGSNDRSSRPSSRGRSRSAGPRSYADAAASALLQTHGILARESTGDKLARAVSPFRSKISKSSRFMTIVGAEPGNKESLFSEVDAREYLRKHVLQQSGDVEDLYRAIGVGCSYGSSISSSLSCKMHEEKDNDLAIQICQREPDYPEFQKHLNWIGDKCQEAGQPNEDARSLGDLVNGIIGAFVASKPTIELCGALGMATAWKKRWGCPVEHTVFVFADSYAKTWNIHAFPPHPKLIPGVYWFWDAKLLGHCGPKRDGSKYLATIESPYDMDACTNRHYPVMNGHVPLTMRHKDQHSGVRKYTNTGMHSLPPDFLEDVDKEQAPWHENVMDFIRFVHVSVEQFAKTYGHEYLAVSANLSHERCPWPVINFVSSGREEFEVVSAKRVTVHTKFNGLCLRGIRMFPCFFPSRVKAFFVCNGPPGDWLDIIPLDPESPLEMPKCRIWWVGPYAVNNMWLRPDCLSSTISLRQWVTPLTVYGGDEVILSHVHVNTVLDHVAYAPEGRPFLGIIPSMNFPINVTYWNKHGTKIGTYNRFSSDLARSLFLHYFPGRPILDKVLHKPTREYRSFSSLREHPDFKAKFDVYTAHIQKWRRYNEAWAEDYRREQKANPLAERLGFQKNTIFFREQQGFGDDGLPEHPEHRVDSQWMWLSMYYTLFVLWFQSYWSYVRSWQAPTFDDEMHPWVSESQEEYPSHLSKENVSEALCIQTLGTRGDTVPLRYLANVAANAGVPVHIINRYHVQTHELEALRDGEVMHLVPAQADLMYSDRLGYRSTFQPHVTVAKGGEYSLAPPKRWINTVRFSDRYDQLPWVKKMVVSAMDIFSALQRPQFHIGALAGCVIPRSLSGRGMLQRRSNTGKFKAGWISGSAAKETIPSYIRDRYPEIPRGDHQEIFRDYETIHCHGGAGTMQTAIACGAKAVSHDATLDRAYKRDLTPSDFKQPSLYVFYGWLLSKGFKLTLPWYHRLRARMTYTWFMRRTYLMQWFYFCAKCYLLGAIGFITHISWLLLLVSMPDIIWRVLETYGNPEMAKQVVKFLWTFPFVLYCSWSTSVCLIALHMDIPLLILMDLVAWYKQEFSLIYEPVVYRGLKTWAPLGHYALRDNRTGEIYEGRFVEEGRTLGCQFDFHTSRRLPQEDAIIIPVQANLADINAMVGRRKAPYSPIHNCVTLTGDTIRNRSFLVSMLVLYAIIVTALFLTGGGLIEQIMRLWDETFDIKKTRFYDMLGFAAGDDDVPIEMEPLVDAPTEGNMQVVQPLNFNLETEENMPQDEVDPPLRELTDPNFAHDVREVNSEECLPELMKSIAAITAVIARETPEEDHDIVFEAGKRTFAQALVDLDLPDDPMQLYQPVPPYVASTWQDVRVSIHDAFIECKRIPFVAECLMYLQHIEDAIEEIVLPVTKLLFYLLRKVYEFGKDQMQKAWDAVCKWLDFAFGEETSQRVKTVWGPTGLWRTSFLDPVRELEASLAMSSFVGKTTFLNDYEGLVEDIKRHASEHKVAKMHLGDIGGPQVRNVRVGTPMMSHNEAKMIGMKEGEYHTTEFYEDKINAILRDGVPQGSDGVIFAQRNPDRIDKSFERYEHQYSREYPKGQEMKMIEAAHTIFNTFNSSFADSQVSSMYQVTKQLKLKYSAGVPFLRNKTTKTRQMLQDKGFLDVFQSLAKEYLVTGKFPVEFFHGFEKSQVVDLGKLIQGKNVRTVVANFLVTTYMEHIFQLDRNKRETWMETGLGSGMPLNQSMARIWEDMADNMKEHGGRFMIMDATQFDSAIAPVAFAGLAELDRLSFQNHEKAAEIHSSFVAKYDAVQQAWIIGITRPESKTLCIAAGDDDTFDLLSNQKIGNLVPFHKASNMSEKELDGKVVLVRERAQKPSFAHWNGTFQFGSPRDRDKEWHHGKPMVYRTRHWRDMVADARAICHSDFSLTSRVYDKNQGIATGFTSVTHSNSWSYRLCLLAAWSDTTGKPTDEFFGDGKNKVANTGDDALWWAAFKSGLTKVKDIYLFQRNCAKYGVTLKLETTRDITQAEYLSKTVTPPTADDSADIKNWKTWKLRNMTNAGKDVSDEKLLSTFNNPRFVVKQNPDAILMRGSGLRYYQGNEQKYLYTMATRDAGHAYVSAFRRGLYCKIAESYCDTVNVLLKQHNIWQRWELRWEEIKGGSSVRMPHVLQVNPRWTEQKLSPRQLAVLTYIKRQAKFPSYLKVIDVHMNIKVPDPQGHARFLAKLAKGSKGWDSAGRDICDWLVTVTDRIPSMLADRFMPGVQAIFPDNPFFTKHDWVCKFTMSKLLTEMPEAEVDYPTLQSRVGEGPYGAVSNTLLFWEHWQDPEYKKKFYSYDHRLFQSMCLLISLIYSWTYFIDVFVGSLLILGPAWRFYTWSYWGLRTIYGVSNTIYWHSKGKSSRTISSLMPKDQYIVAKRFSALVVDFLPEQIGYFLYPLTYINDLLTQPFELAARVYKRGNEMKPISLKHDNIANPWIDFASDYVAKVDEQPNHRLYISAPTGTGKSTFLPAAILATRNHNKVARIWLVLPRLILRDEWGIPFKIPHQILKRGKRRSKQAEIYVLTYGHFMNRLHEVNEENDLVLFDEFHEQSGEMVLAEHKCKARIMLLSATPVNLPTLKNTPTMVPPIKKRFKTIVHRFDDERSVIQMFQMAKNLYPDRINDTLIIVPTKAQVRTTIVQLQWLGHVGYELSSSQRVPPPSGIIVATPYVDVGLDIRPGRSMLIDSGQMIAIDRGRKVKGTPPTDPNRNKQRIGRVGRLKDGIVFQNRLAGTGTAPVQYPSGFMFEHEIISRVYGLPQLTPLHNSVKGAPFLALDPKKIGSKEEQKSLLALHLIALSGERDVMFQTLYNRLLEGDRLGEEQWWIDGIINDREWKRTSMVPWEEAQTLLSITDAVAYGLNNTVEFRGPIQPVKGVWHDVHIDTNADNEPFEDVKPDEVTATMKLDRVTSILNKLTQRLSQVTNDTVKSTILADVSRVTASIIQS